MPPVNLDWLRSKNLDLYIESYSNATRTIQIRGYSSNEQITGSHTTNADRSLATSIIPISDFPLHVSATLASTSVKRGECFLKISVRAEGVLVAVLGTNYIADTTTVIWPGGKNAGSIDGRGHFRMITGTDPAAGVEISETVPTGAIWRLHSLRATLVADATVATRQQSLTFDNGTSVFFRSAISANVTASQTQPITFSTSAVGKENNTGFYCTTIPLDVYLPAGFRINTLTASLQAGDNWGAPLFVVEEWINP